MAETLQQYALLAPDKKRSGVVEIFATAVAMLAALRFMDVGDALGYQYNQEASLGGIGFRSLNGDYAAGAKTTGVVNPVTETLAIMGGTVGTDRQFAANPAYKAGRIAMKAKAASRYFLKMFFDGDALTIPGSFDGLNKRLTGENVVYAGENGGVLDLDVLSALIDRVPGEGGQKRLLMGAAMRRRLGAQIRAAGGTWINVTDWAGPLKPKAFDEVPIIIIGEDEAGVEILGFDEARGTHTGETATTGSIYCVRFGETDEEYLVGLARQAAQGVFEVEDQGTQGAINNTLVEGKFGLALHHPKCAVRYAGILDEAAAPAPVET
jgi:hypothetical protein